MRILLIEDEKIAGKGIESSLIENGHRVKWVKDGKSAKEAIDYELFDVILLDLNLPCLSGKEVLSYLRRQSSKNKDAPTLIMTAHGDQNSKVSLLDQGADDYIVKPLDIDEIQARIRAIYRRRVVGLSSNTLIRGPLEMDILFKRVFINGESIELSPREFTVLQKLLQNQGRVISKQMLLDSLHNEHWAETESNVVEVHIHHLREKFKKLGEDFIKTKRGSGYLIERNHDKKFERFQLGETNNLFKNIEIIASNLPFNFYWEDINSVVLGANEAVVKAVGAKSVEYPIGKSVYDFYPYDMADRIVQHNNEVIKTGRMLSQDEIIKDMTTGEIKCFTAIKAPLRNEKGKIIGIVGTSIEISDQKKYENKIQKIVLQEREKFATLMQNLAGAVAHEVRTPLNSISICTDRLRKFVPQDNEEAQWYMKSIKTAIKESSVVTEMILTALRTSTIEKIETQKFTVHDISGIIQSSIKDYPFKEDEQDWIHFQYKENESFFYYGDQYLTKHILLNLIKNAIHAIEEARKGEIWITLNTSSKRYNKLIFKDTALGIPFEIQKKLFTQFHSSRSLGTGTGLGLTFCRLVMDAYGGTIDCRSVPEKYTEFILRFPKVFH